MHSTGIGGSASVGISLCAMVVSPWMVTAEAGRIPDDPNAFNGYILEASLSSYPSLKLIEVWNADFVREVGLYEKPGETLSLNGVSFTKIRYRFADQQLESIQLTYAGRDNRDKLLRWVEEQYGKLPQAERRVLPQVMWYGNRMAISLSYNPGSKQGFLFFFSPALNHMVNKNINDMPD